MTDSTFTWATVTQVSPLRVKVDGDPAALVITPASLVDPAALAVSDRVRVELADNRIIVHGRYGGGPRLATNAETAAGLLTTPAVTPAGLKFAALDRISAAEARLDNGWTPAIATGLASSGSTATLDSTTGVVTVPAGATTVRVNGLILAGYEYEASFDGAIRSGSTAETFLMRMTEGGVPNSGGHDEGGTYGQYNGTTGVYAGNAASAAYVGSIAGGSAYMDFFTRIFLRPLLGINGPRRYFFTFQSFTMESARGAMASGYTPPATVVYDGLQFYFNTAATGLGQGKFRFFKRKLL